MEQIDPGAIGVQLALQAMRQTRGQAKVQAEMQAALQSVRCATGDRVRQGQLEF